MAVSPAMVKELREKTGAGMMDCKKALEESQGDLEVAIDYLRKKGLAAAQKKASRITSEGAVGATISDDGRIAALYEVNCETDFVARNPDFKGFVTDLGPHIIAKTPLVLKAEEGAGALSEQPWIKNDAKRVHEVLADLIGIIGENIIPRRFVRWELAGSGLFTSYIHMGGKIGVLVELGVGEALVAHPAVAEFGKKLAMQVAAINPVALDRAAVPAETLEREREIYKTQVLESGKPANLADKIVEGKLSKFYKDNCLIEQVWVHDPNQTVTAVVQALSKEIGGEVTVRRFARYFLGEGLEKRSTDLVADVAAQLAGK